jgi:hypothetical protein
MISLNIFADKVIAKTLSDLANSLLLIVCSLTIGKMISKNSHMSHIVGTNKARWLPLDTKCPVFLGILSPVTAGLDNKIL